MLELAEQGLELFEWGLAIWKKIPDVVDYELSIGFREPHGSICSI